MTAGLSVIIPAHNEARWIGRCLRAIFASTGALPKAQVVLAANACTDDTIATAEAVAAEATGWTLTVVQTAVPGKLNALNMADAEATGTIRVYLDADVTVGPSLLAQLVAALDTSAPRYATGTPRIAASSSAASRAYARFWARLPFVAQGTPGFGLFAVNAAGRARWDQWPDIIADDMFARLSFAPAERVRVAARYDWPPVEGFANLIRVRRRQNAGVAELTERFPALMQNEDKQNLSVPGILQLAAKDPAGFATYASVTLGVRSPFFNSGSSWARGR